MNRLASLVAGLVLFAVPARAWADDPSARSAPWQTATTITAVAAMGSQVLMPRVFFSDPNVTVGWKARWHVSVLAPAMTLTALAFLNESAVKGGSRLLSPGVQREQRGDRKLSRLRLPLLPGVRSLVGVCARDGGLRDRHAEVERRPTERGGVRGRCGAASRSCRADRRRSGGGKLGRPRSGSSFERGGPGVRSRHGDRVSLLARPECPYGSGLICW